MTAATVIPTTASELEEMLNDDARMQNVLAEGGFGQFVKNYVEAFRAKDPDHEQQLTEARQQGIFDFLREHGADLTNRPNVTPGSGDKLGRTATAPGHQVDKLFKNHTDFLQAIWYRNSSPDAVGLQNKLIDIRNSFGSTIPSDGGFLIPETLRSNLLRIALEKAVVRPRATVIPMDSLRVPLPMIDDTDHTSSVYGGMIGYWTEEAGALTESSAKFGRVVLEAKKLTGYSEIPNELFTDSIISFQAFLNQVWPQAIAFFEDDGCLNGSGVGEPLGTYNAGCAVSPSRASANLVGFADIAAMYARMLPSSLMDAVWICSPKVIAQLLQLAMTRGTDGIASPPLWLTGGQAVNGPTLQLLGRPLIVTEKAPNLGTAGDLSFVDFGYYLLGDRQAMSLETSPHYKFKNDQTAVRIIERIDGRPWLNSAITPANGGDTLSPIVTLAA